MTRGLFWDGSGPGSVSGISGTGDASKLVRKGEGEEGEAEWRKEGSWTGISTPVAGRDVAALRRLLFTSAVVNGSASRGAGGEGLLSLDMRARN